MYFRIFLMCGKVIDLSLFPNPHESNLFFEEIMVLKNVKTNGPAHNYRVQNVKA
jgi:hypothetical protein